MLVIVNDGGVIDDGTAIHKPGDRVEFEEGEAKRLIKAGKVRPVKPSLHVVVDIDDVVQAIGTLPIDDPALWTKSGPPTVEALGKILGKEITSAERDTAWKIYQQQRSES